MARVWAGVKPKIKSASYGLMPELADERRGESVFCRGILKLGSKDEVGGSLCLRCGLHD